LEPRHCPPSSSLRDDHIWPDAAGTLPGHLVEHGLRSARVAVSAAARCHVDVLPTTTATTIPEILGSISPHVSSGLTIAIDAPTIVPNETGMRPVERHLQRGPEFQRAHAAPHPANRQLLGATNGGIPRGSELMDALRREPLTHSSCFAGPGARAACHTAAG
jgi:predicted RNase H-like nuclease